MEGSINPGDLGICDEVNLEDLLELEQNWTNIEQSMNQTASETTMPGILQEDTLPMDSAADFDPFSFALPTTGAETIEQDWVDFGQLRSQSGPETMTNTAGAKQSAVWAESRSSFGPLMYDTPHSETGFPMLPSATNTDNSHLVTATLPYTSPFHGLGEFPVPSSYQPTWWNGQNADPAAWRVWGDPSDETTNLLAGSPLAISQRAHSIVDHVSSSPEMASASYQTPSTRLPSTASPHIPRAGNAFGRSGENFKCDSCSKPIKPRFSNGPLLCARCTGKAKKNNATPPVYRFHPNISFEVARDNIFPIRGPLDVLGQSGLHDDAPWQLQAEQEWVKRFIDAANRPYDLTAAQHRFGPDFEMQGDHHHYMSQQAEYNKKPFHDASKHFFTDFDVNVRMRLLFHAIMRYHLGGQAIYPTGAENRGYGENKMLRCSARLELIESLLSLDKKIVIDVIEGRGVQGLVANPQKFADRKTQNNKSNKVKESFITMGKGEMARVSDPPGVSPGHTSAMRPAKRRRAVSSTPTDE